MSFFGKWKSSSGVAGLIILVAAALIFGVTSVIAQVSLAPLNPDFLEYLKKLQESKVQMQTAEGYALGFIPPPLDLSHLAGQPIFQAHELAALPSSYDLRTLGKVTPVRDQGNCGSCWAFATYGSLESDLLPSETWDFSENNLKNTDGFDWGSCDGGNGFMSTAYLARWSGPISEADDPYNPSSNVSPPGLTSRKHLQEVLLISGRANSLDNVNIKQAVMTYGALDATMYWDNAFYNSAYSAYYYNGGGTPNASNHAVAIVGWDDNFDKNKFSTIPPGNGAFLIKNSWGTGFGENGYFYISYYDTNIGSGTNLMFNGAEPTDNYLRTYQYDPLGWTESIGSGYNDSAWFANIFTASGEETLKAVSFYTASANSAYEIYVYTDVTSGPTSGSLAGTRTGTISPPGYHTIPLNSSIFLTSGQSFSVVVKLTTPGFNYPIPVEAPVADYSSLATAQAGESYVSLDGSTWDDITLSFSDTNVCLKAFTVQEHNLTPYQPPGWSDKIVVSNVPGTITDSQLTATDTLYIDWAVLNDGTVSISKRFYVALYVDGALKNSWQVSSLDADSYVNVEDYSIGSLSAGTHKIKIVADSTKVVSETNEGDNEYTKTITVLSAVTVTTNPSGLQIVTDSSSYATPHSFYWTLGSTHTISVSSPQSGTPGTQYVFSSWNDGGAQTHSITAPSEAKSFTASFFTQYSLTTSSSLPEGGTVSPSGTKWYDSGKSVSITAKANSGYTFIGWSGDLSGTTNPKLIRINGPKNITANFAKIKLLSPNGGEAIASGSTYTIQWEGPSDLVTYGLSYSVDNGLTWSPIASGVTGTSYLWQPVPIPNGNRTTCLVSVSCFNSTSGVKVKSVKSAAAFTIEVVKVTSPNGGETLTSGSTDSITWATNGTKKQVVKVKLSYSKNGGATWYPITTLPGNPGSYDTWKVLPVANLKSQCKVKVVLKDASENTLGSDVSDNYFTIKP